MVMVAHQLSMASIHGSSGRVLSTLLLTACTPMPMWRGRPCARATVPQLMGRGADTSGGLSMEDPRLYTVEVDRVTGIDFGCDLALRWLACTYALDRARIDKGEVAPREL